MKRALIASILGISISAGASTSPLKVYFDNYNAVPFTRGNAVSWTEDPALAPPSRAGQPVVPSEEFFADLVWQYGSKTGDAGLAVPTILIPGYGTGWIIGGPVNTVSN